MRNEKFFRQRLRAYMYTYKAFYKMGKVYTPWGDYLEGFLYQRPNPDYDKWLPENCTPIYFKDWVPQIVGNMPRPKPGPKSHYGILTVRPIICIETKTLYMSVKECREDTDAVHCDAAARNVTVFANNLRFVYPDIFMPWDDREWKPEKKVLNYNMNSSKNRSVPVRIIETGEEFPSKGACYRELGKRFNVHPKTIQRNMDEWGEYEGFTVEGIWN